MEKQQRSYATQPDFRFNAERNAPPHCRLTWVFGKSIVDATGEFRQAEGFLK